MASRRSSPTPWFVGGGVVFVLALGALALARSRSETAGAVSASASDSATIDAVMAAASASETQGAESADRASVLSKTSLADAIAATKPKMTNTNARLDEGAALFALWASKNLTWNDLSSLVETTPALFRKDPDAERGKRLCVSGTINEIRAEKTLATRLVEDRALPLIREQHTTSAPTAYPEAPSTASGPDAPGLPAAPDTAPSGPDPWAIPDGGKVFFATISAKSDDSSDAKSRPSNARSLTVEVIAVHSTGTLVDGGEIRACGVLTGVTMPAGSSSGDTMEHRIVGLFDLPENRAAELAKTKTE